VGEAQAAAAAGSAKPITSEKIFRQRLTGALKKGSIRELRAIFHDPQLEPHMHLFLMICAAVLVGALIWVVEPLLV